MCVPTTVYNRGTQYSSEQLRQSSKAIITVQMTSIGGEGDSNMVL